MKRSFIFLFCLLIFSKVLYADNNGPSNHYSHKGHMHKEFVKGEKLILTLIDLIHLLVDLSRYKLLLLMLMVWFVIFVQEELRSLFQKI